jgi:hypothetical protein
LKEIAHALENILADPMKLTHYTLNTPHTVLLNKKVDRTVIKSIEPIIFRALEEWKTRHSLPTPLDNYNVLVSVTPGCALFDIYHQSEHLLSVNAIAWTQADADYIWGVFEEFCVEQSTVLAGYSLRQPDRLPWLATLTLPSLLAVELTWLADFEQSLAVGLIQSAIAGNKPKGFG